MFSLPVTTVAKVRKLVICDRKGIPRAVFGEHDDGTFGLRIFDSEGRARVTLGIEGDSSAGMYLHDKSGARRVDLLVDPDNIAGLQISDVDDKASALFASAVNKGTQLRLFDREKQVRVDVGVDEDGIPRMMTLDEEGRVEAELELPVEAEEEAETS